MGHRVALLKDGILQQADTPRNLYDRPGNAFVAGFIGSPAMNLRTVPLNGNGAVIGGTTVPLQPAVLDAAHKAGLDKITVGIRPESFHDSTEGITLTVNLVEELGADAFVYGTLPGDDAITDKPFTIRFDGRVPPRIGDIIHVAPRPGEEHAFNPETGERLA